jgi:hypothetical protein
VGCIDVAICGPPKKVRVTALAAVLLEAADTNPALALLLLSPGYDEKNLAADIVPPSLVRAVEGRSGLPLPDTTAVATLGLPAAIVTDFLAVLALRIYLLIETGSAY